MSEQQGETAFVPGMAEAVEEAPAYVNYLDVKLHQVMQLPREWYESASDAPAYSAHPFRYEVTVHLPTDAAGNAAPALRPQPTTPTTTNTNTNPSAGATRERKSISSATPSAAAATAAAAAANETSHASGSTATNAAAANATTATAAAAAAANTTSFTFTHGRMLQPLPQYIRYIELAAPPAMEGLDEVSAIRDIPEPLELTNGGGGGENNNNNNNNTAMLTTQDGEAPLHTSVLVSSPNTATTVATTTTASVNAHIAGGNHHLSPASANSTNPALAAHPAANSEAGHGNNAAATLLNPPVLLWIANESTDAPPPPQPVAESTMTRRRKKNGTAGASTTSAIASTAAAAAAIANMNTNNATSGPEANANALPAVPGKAEPAPCVLRIPLTASQEASLESLLTSGHPLMLSFRRVLKPGLPPDWEDLNAAYYEAILPVSLGPLSEPGSLGFDAHAQLELAAGAVVNGNYYAEMAAMGGTLPSNTNNAANNTNANAHPANAAPGANAAAPGANTAGSIAPSDHERTKRRAAARRSKSGIPPTLYEEPDGFTVHPYLVHGTTAVLSFRLKNTLTRLASDRVRPGVTPAQLIATHRTSPAAPLAEKGGSVHAMRSAARPGSAMHDATAELNAAIRTIATRLLQDFRAASSQVALDAQVTTLEEREAWRSRFLDYFQSTGQLLAYQSYLAPLVQRVVRDTFPHTAHPTRQELSNLTSELYVYLLECVHTVLPQVLQIEEEGEAKVQEEESRAGTGHEADASSNALSATRPTSELAMGRHAPHDSTDDNVTVEQKWLQRAREAEASREYTLATKYHQARITTNEQAACFPRIWCDAAEFYIRVGDAVRAEQCYREAIACDAACLRALLGYGVWLMAYDRLAEAAVFLHGAVDVAPRHALAWGCIALLDDLFLFSLREGSPGYEAEQAKWTKEHRYAIQQAIQQCNTKTKAQGDAAQAEGNSDGAAMSDTPVSCMPVKDEQDLCLQLADLLLRWHHADLANIGLTRCETNTPTVERLYARLFTQTGQYTEALRCLASLEALEQNAAAAQAAAATANTHDETNDGGERKTLTMTEQTSLYDVMRRDEVRLLRADCLAALGENTSAIALYKEVLCKALCAVPPYIAYLASDDHARHIASGEAQNNGEEAGGEEDDKGVSRIRGLAPEVRNYLHHRFVEGYLHLGNLLLAHGKYKDALGVFTLGIQAWPCGLTWLGAGVAYYRMGDLPAAEECLNESNTRNPLNPRTWAFLALLCLHTNRPELEDVVQQVRRQGLRDAAMWAELGRELLQPGARPQLSEICLRQALSFALHELDEAEGVRRRQQQQQEELQRQQQQQQQQARGRSKPKRAAQKAGSDEQQQQQQQRRQASEALCVSLRALVGSTRYYLAQALREQQRWQEARQLLLEVSRGTSNEMLRAKAEQDLQDLQDEM